MGARVRLIGDGHGNLVPVRQGASLGLTMVHLGDLGFAREWRKAARIPNLHVVAGNHDDIPFARETPIYLGDFGDLGDRVPGAEGTFFVRGAETLDVEGRREGRDWWPEDEQLDPPKVDAAEAAYLALRPHTVLSHDAPTSIVRLLHGDAAVPSRTSDLLQRMFDVYQPSRWYFGHHHTRWETELVGTRFRCLDIDEVVDAEFNDRHNGLPESER